MKAGALLLSYMHKWLRYPYTKKRKRIGGIVHTGPGSLGRPPSQPRPLPGRQLQIPAAHQKPRLLDQPPHLRPHVAVVVPVDHRRVVRAMDVARDSSNRRTDGAQSFRQTLAVCLKRCEMLLLYEMGVPGETTSIELTLASIILCMSLATSNASAGARTVSPAR